MANKKKQLESITVAQIDSEEKLSDFLSELGFNSRPISAAGDIRIMHPGKLAGQPQRYLIAQDNEGFQFHAVVSIEAGSICIYYYQMENDLFRIWEMLSGDVKVEQIKTTIRVATTEEEILKRFYT
jgi:hypothetical protein